MKKMFKMGCLGIMGLFALIVVVALFSGGGEETTTTVVTEEASTKESADKPKEEKKAKVGDTLYVGKVGFRVNGTEKKTNIGGEFGENSKGEYLVVSVSVINKGDESLMVDSSFFKIKADGKEYEADGTATIFANENADFFLTDLNPDLQVDGNVVFDLPAELHSKDLVLNVQTGFFGTEQGQINLK